MSWLSRWVKRRADAADRKAEFEKNTFLMDIEWERGEELRTERLGPGPDDVPDPIPVDQWRPRKTLGGWTRYR